MVICLEQGADLHMGQLMPLPLTVPCFSKIQIGFTFLVPAHLGSPGKRAVKRMCACVLLLQTGRVRRRAAWVGCVCVRAAATAVTRSLTSGAKCPTRGGLEWARRRPSSSRPRATTTTRRRCASRCRRPPPRRGPRPGSRRTERRSADGSGFV